MYKNRYIAVVLGYLDVKDNEMYSRAPKFVIYEQKEFNKEKKKLTKLSSAQSTVRGGRAEGRPSFLKIVAIAFTSLQLGDQKWVWGLKRNLWTKWHQVPRLAKKGQKLKWYSEPQIATKRSYSLLVDHYGHLQFDDKRFSDICLVEWCINAM